MLAAEFSNDRFWPGLFGPPLRNSNRWHIAMPVVGAVHSIRFRDPSIPMQASE